MAEDKRSNKPITVTISRHAVERGVERCGLTDIKTANQVMRAEIRAALAEGRMSKSRPAWATALQRQTSTARRHTRHLWNEDRSRLYVVHPLDDEIKVITVLVPFASEEDKHVHVYKERAHRHARREIGVYYRKGRKGRLQKRTRGGRNDPRGRGLGEDDWDDGT